jgi:topoisomerase-4 subunit A
VKRFPVDDVQNRKIGFIGDHPANKLVHTTWVGHPRLELNFGGKNEGREPEVIDVDEFIGVKSYKAKGKRLSIYEISQVKELEPVVTDEETDEEDQSEVPQKEEDIPDIEDLLFGKPSGDDKNSNQMLLEF